MDDHYYRNAGGLFFEFEDVTEFAYNFLKIGLACSPIIAVGLVLAFAREDEEEEKAKQEQAKNVRSCKS